MLKRGVSVLLLPMVLLAPLVNAAQCRGCGAFPWGPHLHLPAFLQTEDVPCACHDDADDDDHDHDASGSPANPYDAPRSSSPIAVLPPALSQGWFTVHDADEASRSLDAPAALSMASARLDVCRPCAERLEPGGCDVSLAPASARNLILLN
jgi:hypothetical protein